jgi:hypothetical protein
MDPEKDREFLRDPDWERFGDKFIVIEAKKDSKNHGEAQGNSFSGNERNRLFLQQDGNFDDASLVSGLDFLQDGRGFAILDFDQDGFLDIGAISNQTPRFRLMKNKLADRTAADQSKPVFIKLVGGHRGKDPQTEWSAVDAIGAKLLVSIGKTKRAFQLSCGEGLSTQNSSLIHIGMGASQKIDAIEVHWPSGKKTIESNVKAGSRITLFENPADK